MKIITIDKLCHKMQQKPWPIGTEFFTAPHTNPLGFEGPKSVIQRVQSILRKKLSYHI